MTGSLGAERRGGFGLSPWCIVLVCSWRRLLADHHCSTGGGAHCPLTTLCPASSSLPYLSLSTSLSFPLAFPSSSHPFPFISFMTHTTGCGCCVPQIEVAPLFPWYQWG